MTSEVLILNKRGVVLAADSAVTTSGGDGDHPRYSKSANKIFELSRSGAIAAAIYGSANLETVPWELALKLFRAQLADTTFKTVVEYSDALVAFLSGNNCLFPRDLRIRWIENQFDRALRIIIEDARQNDPLVFDTSLPLEDRQKRMKDQESRIRALAAQGGVSSPLTQGALDHMLLDIGPWEQRAKSQIDLVPGLDGVDPLALAELGHIIRYWLPERLLGSTGLVIAGYGDDQIFPAFVQLEVFGHIGDELCIKLVKEHAVTHVDGATIQPLAQTSMIDMFTDGFGDSLRCIIDQQGYASLERAFGALALEGIHVPAELAKRIALDCHSDFMSAWMKKNWEENFHPLIGVLQNLSIQEMAHLAESLLGLQSLKERVTSPTESVGGPIDVAVITKTEGLVWIKRKHYFDVGLNMRYATRLERSMNLGAS